MIKKLQPLITHKTFNAAWLNRINTVASNLCAWVLAMVKYYSFNLIVKPKKASLAIVEKEYAELSAAINEKKENLRIVQENVARLQAQLKAAREKKASLEAQVADCIGRLNKAQKLKVIDIPKEGMFEPTKKIFVFVHNRQYDEKRQINGFHGFADVYYDTDDNYVLEGLVGLGSNINEIRDIYDASFDEFNELF